MGEISIIVPVYNEEKLIEKCIKSILNQTYKNFELIIINDGSTDNTENIIKSFLNNTKIKLYNTENQGTGHARNYGLKVANGKLITFIDADDSVDKNYLQHINYIFEKYDPDIIACKLGKSKNNKFKEDDFSSDEKNSIKEKKDFSDVDKSSIKEKNVFSDVDKKNIDNNIHILNKIEGFNNLISLPEKMTMSIIGKAFKKNIIKDISFDESNKFEDIDFAVKAFLNSEKIIYYEEILYYYKNKLNSRSKSLGDDRIKACFTNLEYIEKNYNELIDNYYSYMIFNCIGVANRMILNGSYNLELLKKIKSIIKENISHVKKSDYAFYKKAQIYLFNFNFSLYKILYSIINKFNKK